VGCIVAAGRKGSYIGMFAFTCDLVTIPVWIAARSQLGFSGSAGLTRFRLALQHARSTSNSTNTGRRFVARASWCATPAAGESEGTVGAWA
jgi:hypothetical protein